LLILKIPDSLREERYEFQRTHRHIIKDYLRAYSELHILLVLTKIANKDSITKDLYHRQKLATASDSLYLYKNLEELELTTVKYRDCQRSS